MSKKNKFDYVVVGSNLSSLLIADKLGRRGFDVALIPAKESLEDFRKDSDQSPINSHEPFMFMGFSAEKELLINWLEDEFYTEDHINFDIIDLQPITFDGGEFKPFLGFGDRKFATIDDLNEYTNPKRIQLETRVQCWINDRLKNPSFEILEKTMVSDLTIEDKRITELTLNGKKQIYVGEVIYTGDPKDLLELIHDDHFATREKQKVAKSQLWTRLNLSFQFSAEADHKPGLHVLMGTKDDFEPVIGEFYLDDAGVMSNWTYLVDPEVAETAEGLAGVIKYIKRQIKRAYPELLTLEHTEKIKIYSNTHGSIKSWDKLRLKNLENLILASPQFSGLTGIAAGLDMTQKVLSELIGSPSVKLPTEAAPEPGLNA